MNIVFVYGSLKRGFHNHHYLLNSSYLGDFTSEAKFTMYDYGAYPAVAVHGSTAIVGELFQITKQVMDDLDYLEEYPDLYDRIQIPTPHGLAWMYVINEIRASSIVVRGVWLNDVGLQLPQK